MIRVTNATCTPPAEHDLISQRDHETPPIASAPLPTLRCMCHLYSAGLPPQCLVELQFRDRLCIDTRIVQQPIMPGFRCQAFHLVKL